MQECEVTLMFTATDNARGWMLRTTANVKWTSAYEEEAAMVCTVVV